MNPHLATTEDAAAEEAQIGRRRFLGRVSLALGGLAAAVISVPILAYLLSPILRPAPQVWRDVANINDIGVGETVERDFDEPSSLPWAGQTARTAIWLRRTADREFIAFGLSCTHLGCPVNWRPEAELFLCPCHGGVYYANGDVAAGPPPRALQKYPTRVRAGYVELKTGPIPFAY
jgi:menaquinol-cytochrome c reductase iron-sulfur subunit